MSIRPLPEPPRTDVIRILLGLALVAITCAAVAVTVFALRASGAAGDVDRLVERTTTVVDDATQATERLERTSRDFDSTIDDLREAARALRDLRSQIGETP